jgi:transcriptional regulator with XRE-family HTH domain
MASHDAAPKGSPRQVFGSILRFYRDQASLTREELAARAHVSASTIRAYEEGRRVPTRASVADIEAVQEMRTSGALLALWDQFEQGMSYAVFPDWLEDWAETVEPVAATLRWYETVFVPALLQTEDYMRAVFSARFAVTTDQVEDRVVSRMKRQQILHRDDPPALWIILDHNALTRPIGGRHVMAEQVRALIEAAQRSNIRIEIIPPDAGAHEGLAGAFALADFDDGRPSVGYQEAAALGLPLKDPKDVAALDLTWTTLRSETLPRGASITLLEEAAKSWTSPT